MRAGCKCFFGYPITPQTELSAYLAKHMAKRGGTFLQAESEIAAVNMVLGASSCGVRAMTSSSSPGISLKSEGISYIAGSDLPCVIVNVQRGGPGLGGIQPSQSDYWQATKALGHGDFQDIVPDIPEKPWACCGHKNKREHNIINSLYLKPDELENSVLERYKRYDAVKRECTDAEAYLCDDAEIVITAYGASARVAKSAVNGAREKGIKAGLFRPKTLYPYPVNEINEACRSAKTVLSVEMSMGQMVDDVKLALNCRIPVEFFGRTGGIIPTPSEVLEKIESLSERPTIKSQ